MLDELDRVSLPSDWDTLLTDHSDAVDQFIKTAHRCAGEAWMRPLAPGKWSPGEVTSHVSEAYRILQTELGGGAGMRLLGSPLQRWLLRRTMLPRLCQGRPFPPGARAPKETRPREVEESPSIALETLGLLARSFTQELTGRAQAGRVRLTHAYFGSLPPRQGLQLVIWHTRHHARQLESCGPVS